MCSSAVLQIKVGMVMNCSVAHDPGNMVRTLRVRVGGRSRLSVAMNFLWVDTKHGDSFRTRFSAQVQFVWPPTKCLRGLARWLGE